MGEPAPRRKVTYDDVRNAPEHMIAEIIDGELYTSPRPGPRHAQSSSALGSVIHAAYGGRGNGDGPGQPGGWWILDEPELHLGEDVLVPDVAGWRRERMPHLPADAFFSLAPDWACEVVSPSSSRLDRVQKKRIYARNGVGHLWLVDPLAQTLEVLRLAGDLWQEIAVHGGDETVTAQPFDAVRIDLSRWWEA